MEKATAIKSASAVEVVVETALDELLELAPVQKPAQTYGASAA